MSQLDAIRLAHIFVTQKRLPELKKLLAKPKLFPHNGVNLPYASGDPYCITEIAAATGDLTFFNNVVAAIKEAQSSTFNYFNDDCILRQLTSGHANIHMLGHRTRAIEAGRGSQQGNNALIIHDISNAFLELDTAKLISNGCTFEMLEAIQKSGIGNENLANKVINAVRKGDRILAALLIKAYSSHSFNDLHINTLMRNDGTLPKFMPISVTKKAQNNKNITPIHTAAINPDVNILKTVLKFEYNFNAADSEGWHTLHYAAVCKGREPLSHLLRLKAPLTALNKYKESALHVAAEVGRLENVKLLVETAKKTGNVNIFNLKNIKGYTPLHLAVKNDHIQVVKYLLADPNIKPDIPLVSSSEKLTPLMTATSKGNLAMVRLLIDEANASIDAGDKFKRTALIHAILCGQDHIFTDLLARGASVTMKPDSSRNTAAHYAAAYGWQDELQALYQADPDSMVVKNAWCLSPMMVAYLKGHFDIVDWYVTSKFEGLSSKISIDDGDIEGLTLLMHVIKSGEGVDKQDVNAVRYLLNHNADVKVKNAQGETAFMLFAEKAVRFVPNVDSEGENLTKDEYLELASLLSSNFNPSIITSTSDSGKTPLMSALATGNFALAAKLLEKAGKQYIEIWKSQTEGNTILHNLLDGTSKICNHLINAENESDTIKLVAFTTFEVCNPIPVFTTVIELLQNANLLIKATETRDAEGVSALIKAIWITRKIEVNNSNITNMTSASNMVIKKLVAIVEQLVIANRESVLLQVIKPNGTLASDFKNTSDTDNDNYSINNEFQSDSDKSEESMMEVDLTEQKPYSPNAFEYTINFDQPLTDEKSFTLLNSPTATKFYIPNALMEVILKNIQNHVPLLKKVLTKVDRRFGFNGLTPFLYCLENGYVNSAAYILKTAETTGLSDAVLGAVLEGVTTDFGKTATRFRKHALLIAIHKQCFSIIDYIATNSKIALIPDEKGLNALHYLAKSCHDVTEHMNTLIKKKIELTTDSFNRHPLHYATAAIQTSNFTDVCPFNVEFLLKVDPNSVAIVDTVGRTPLHAALVGLTDKIEDFDYTKVACFDPIIIVVSLLQRMTTNQIDLPDALGNTALHYAAMAGAHSSLSLLLKRSVDINITNSFGNTPIGYAVVLQRETITIQLVLLKAIIGTFCTVTKKPESCSKSTETNVWKVGAKSCISNNVCKTKEETRIVSILELSVSNDWQAIVYIALDLLYDDVGRVSALIDLISAAVAKDRKNLLQVLLKRLTPAIHWNNTNGPEVQIEASKRAFESFANTATDSGTSNPILGLLFDAGLSWTFESIETLAKRGAVTLINQIYDLDAMSSSPRWADFKKSEYYTHVLIHLLRFWSDEGSDDLKKFILNHYTWETLDSCHDIYLDVTNAVKSTPLIYAITEKKIPLIKFLIQEADVDRGVADAKLVTPFMRAIATNDNEIIEILVKRGIHNKQNHPNPAMPITVDDTNLQQTSNFSFLPFSQVKSRSLLKRRKQAPALTIGTTNNMSVLIDSDFIIDNIDSDGLNAIHYLVQSKHENVDFLMKLYLERPKQIPYMIIEETQAGTPYSMALKFRQKTLLAEFQRILKAAKVPNYSKYIHEVTPFSIESEILNIPKPVGNVEVDSKAFMASQRTQISNKLKPDPRKPFRLCQNTDNGEIVVDDDSGKLYKVLMHKTDHGYGYTGWHNYYRIELVQRKRSDFYVLFTHWGRIGDSTGQFQHTPFNIRAIAIKEFKSIYLRKSGNDFDAATFIEKPGKYRLVDIPDEDYVDLADLDIKLIKGLPSSEVDPVYNVIRDFSNVDLLKKKWKVVNSMASSSVPFGRASKEKLLHARKILSELEELAASPENNDSSCFADTIQPTAEQIIEKLQKQYKLSSEFFMTLLLGNYAFEKLPIIDNQKIVKQFSKIIDQFFEIENGALLIAAAAQRQSTIDPYRYILSSLDSKFEIIDQYGEFAQMVLQGIANQTPEVKVTGIFEVLSRSAAQNFVSKSRNNKIHRYLWHGTRAENLLSILKVGLVVTPAHALWNGATFGEGIYLADTIAKAQNYSSESAEGYNYVLICEVSVDKVYAIAEHQLLSEAVANCVKNVDMVVATGQTFPDPKDDVTTIEGIRFSRGPLLFEDSRYTWCQPTYNEYVIKDRANVLPRYLVQFL